MTPDQVKFTLSQIGYQRPFQVIFRKKDGTQRKMLAAMDKPSGTRKPSPDVVPVMDMISGEWRSFRIDSVLSLEY